MLFQRCEQKLHLTRKPGPQERGGHLGLARATSGPEAHGDIPEPPPHSSSPPEVRNAARKRMW